MSPCPTSETSILKASSLVGVDGVGGCCAPAKCACSASRIVLELCASLDIEGKLGSMNGAGTLVNAEAAEVGLTAACLAWLDLASVAASWALVLVSSSCKLKFMRWSLTTRSSKSDSYEKVACLPSHDGPRGVIQGTATVSTCVPSFVDARDTPPRPGGFSQACKRCVGHGARCWHVGVRTTYLDKRSSSSGSVTPSKLMGGAFLRPRRRGSCCMLLITACAHLLRVAHGSKERCKAIAHYFMLQLMMFEFTFVGIAQRTLASD